MSRHLLILLVVAVAVVVCGVSAADAKVAVGDDGSRFKQFLLRNMFRDSLPASFLVEPPDYFKNVPHSLRPHDHTEPERCPDCGNITVAPKLLNAYEFQTEQLIAALGIDIYDAAVWCVAVSLLGHAELCLNYTTSILIADRTFRDQNIRGDAACQGVMEYGECPNPPYPGWCGLCYGDEPGNANKTLTQSDAYIFQILSDYWYIEDPDARCPHVRNWTWNDWKPILGENAWCMYTGPIHNAMIRHNYVFDNVPDSDPAFTLGLSFLDAIEKMKVGDTGAIYYTPRNTYFGKSKGAMNVGSTFSIENQCSLLAGIKALYTLIDKKQSSQHKSYLPRIKGYMDGLQKIILASYDAEAGYFRQGGTYNATSQKLSWGQNGQPSLATDCQTWCPGVLGPELIDKTFGANTSYNLWTTLKQLAGFNCTGGLLCGFGYTRQDNVPVANQVLSGEWSYGAVNWARILQQYTGLTAAQKSEIGGDITSVLYGLENYVVTSTPVRGNGDPTLFDSVMYANKRYFIPFGWWANAIPATASTGWAVMVAQNYNPLDIMGKYTSS